MVKGPVVSWILKCMIRAAPTCTLWNYDMSYDELVMRGTGLRVAAVFAHHMRHLPEAALFLREGRVWVSIP